MWDFRIIIFTPYVSTLLLFVVVVSLNAYLRYSFFKMIAKSLINGFLVLTVVFENSN